MRLAEPREPLLQRQADCPSVEALAIYSESPEKAVGLRPHIENCANCQTEIRLLESFLAASAAEHERDDTDSIARALQARFSSPIPSTAKGFSWWPGWRIWVPVASMLVLLAVSMQWQQQGSKAEADAQPIFRDVPHIEVYIPRQGEQNAFSEFRWQSISAADSYRLKLTEVDGTVAYTSASQTNSLPLDAEAKDLLLPRKTLQFSVEALDRSGKIVARSSSIRVRLDLAKTKIPKD